MLTRRSVLSVMAALSVMITVLVSVVTISVSAPRLALAGSDDPAHDVADALELARAETSVHVLVDLDQTLVPLPAFGNMGRSEVHETLRLEGDLVQPEHRSPNAPPDARLTLSTGGGDGSVDLLIVGGESFVGYQGRWKQIDDPLGMSAPGGDYLGFLAAVVDVEETEPVDTAAGTMRRYTFGIDGPRYAEQVRLRAEQMLKGKLPHGTQVSASPVHERMSGTGEVWVDSDGRPRREIIDVSMPQATDGYDGRSHIEVDFTRYGARVSGIEVPLPTGNEGVLELPASDAPDAESGFPGEGDSGSKPDAGTTQRSRLPRVPLLPLASLAVILSGSIAVRCRRNRTVYLAIVLAVITSMLSSPLLHAHSTHRFRHMASKVTPFSQALTDVGLTEETSEIDEFDAIAERVDAMVESTTGTNKSAKLLDCRTLYVDQGISQTDDEDNDGLTNAEEWCLGTNYTAADTDFDAITDTLEVNGFDYNGTHWTLDPLSEDTNEDGMADGNEWFPNAEPNSKSSCPDKDHPEDCDGDGLPNVWDDDNDNDGVLDRDDISPYASYPLRPTVNVTVTGEVTTYVDLQLRPENDDHLRLATTYLDWPADSEGQIQDLDGSTRDLHLIPVFEMLSPISPTLSAQYGMVAFTDTHELAFRIWAPLQPVGDAGATSAFFARLAFTAEEAAADINLTEGQIRWVAQAQLDSYTNGNSGDVTTEGALVSSYVEELVRVTGLNVIATQDLGVGIFGTKAPEISSDSTKVDEAKTMFNLLSGLAPTYLANEKPSLRTIVDNFSSSGATPPYTDTWGVDPTTVFTRFDRYGHRDEALANTSITVTKEFLDKNYMPGGSCKASVANTMTPTLVTAVHESNASLDGSNPLVTVKNAGSSTNLKPIQFVFPLQKAAVQVVRRVQLTMYDCGTSPGDNTVKWRAVLAGDAVAEIHRRYPDDSKADWMGLVDLLFTSYYMGRSRIISVNGHKMPHIGDLADPNDLSDWMLPSATTLPRYVRGTYHLDSFLADVSTTGPVHAFHDWSGMFGRDVVYGRYATIGFVLLFRTYKFLRRWKGAITWYKYTFNALESEIENGSCWSELPWAEDQLYFKQVGGIEGPTVAQEVRLRFWNRVNSGTIVSEIREAQIESEVAEGKLISEEGIAQAARRAKIGAGVFAALITIMVGFMIWMAYASAAKSLSGIAKDNLLAESIATTIILVVQLIIDLILIGLLSTGVGFIIEIIILAVLWLIVVAVTCAKKDCDFNPLDSFAYLSKWIASAILHVGMLAKIPDDNGVDAGAPVLKVFNSRSSLNQGSLVGNGYNIRTTLTATIEEGPGKTGWNYTNGRSGDADDVKKSWGFARFAKNPEDIPYYTSNYNIANTLVITDSSAPGNSQCTSVTGDHKLCVNTGALDFTVTEAGRDLGFPFVNEVGVYLRYLKCWGAIGYNCSTDMNFYLGPTKPPDDAPQDVQDAWSDAQQSMYLDVLPATMDELLLWGAPTSVGDASSSWNLDIDNDSLTDTVESAVGTITSTWDTDGDLLSDGYEYLAREMWKTSPTLKDTDGDSLDDSFELTLSTDASKADTDDDGLTDAEEVCHVDAEGKLVGGWAIRLDGIGQQSEGVKWVCSDPLKSDADLDGMLDKQERAAGTSPFAPNKAPGLDIGVEPTAVHGRYRATVLQPGDALTVSVMINNSTSEPVVRPVTMTYPSSDISDMAATGQTSAPPEYTPPSPQAISGGFVWDYGDSPLLSIEATTTTLKGDVDSGIRQSLVSQIEVTVPYTEVISATLSLQKLLTGTHPVLIDVDDPSTTIGAPADGDAIKGESYVIGGTADDPTSWPVEVEVSTDGGSTWDAATGADTWGWTWTLPADGAYTVKARATDYVGRVETPGDGIEVIVDNTAPGAAFEGLSDGDVLTDIRLDRLVVRGTATDLLSGASDVAGLTAVQISIDDRPWHNIPGAEFPASPHPQTADWHYVWGVSGERNGDHSLAVRAVDALGQIGEATKVTVTVDTREPGDILSNARPDVASGGPVTLLGHVDDEANVPPPARPVSLETGPVRASEVISGATVWLMPEGPTTSTLSATWLGDVDGDRRADMVVGTPHKAVGGVENAGRVSIVYGRAGGWPVPPEALAVGDSASSYAGALGSKLGEHVAAAGDVNADGLSDMLIGDPLNGQVYLVFGRATAMGTDQDPQALRQSTYRMRGKILQVESGQIGKWLSSAGDVNGDGYDDMLVGVTGLGGKSAIYLVLGSASTSGPLAYSQVFTLDNQAGLRKPVVAAVYDLDGGSALATGIGDVNGDQYGDFAVVAPNVATYVILGGSSFSAKARPEPVNPADAAAGSVTHGLPDGKHLVALGDVTGDGLPDVGFSSGNHPQVVFGRAEGWTAGMTADASFDGYSPAPNGFVAAVGDVNADGRSDMLLGTLSGRAYLVHGRSDLATSQPVAAVLSNAGDAASAPYAAGADGNCDDSSDLLLLPMAWEGSGTDAVDSSTGAPAAQRTMRPELSLGPATAPRSLSELPSVSHGGSASPATGLAIARVPGDETPLRLAAAPATRYVDDDYCEACFNDGHTWGTDAFATIQDGLDAAGAGDDSTRGDTVLVGPGVYREQVVFHAGKDYVTLRGVDPDAVFLDADGGLGIEVFPPAEYTPEVPRIEGVTIEGLTIRNASTSVEVNYGGKSGVSDVADPGNIRIRNVLLLQAEPGGAAIAVGNAVNRSSSNVLIRHNTMVADASSVKLVHNIPAALASNVFLQDNMFTSLPNASPKPDWYIDDNGNMAAVKVNDRNGFASQSGVAGDWATAPLGNNAKLMSLTAAEFQDLAGDVFRVGPGSAGHGLASDAKDLGYYTYHDPVWVDPTYCAKCDNDGRTWGTDAFASVQAAIDTGAWKVSLDPGVYRERAYLVNGVAVFGSGAALTVLAPPDASDGVVLSAEGVSGAQVALVTLTGDGHDVGLRLDAGAAVALERSVVRDARTAVAVDGSDGGATATLVNDTLVGNAAGVAATSCGNVDVNNTILAYHTGTALAFEQCATTKLHTYDLYWRNGQDLDDGASDAPTPGEVYAAPRFVDASHNDYRPLPDSPAVDAGDPRSPHPPGTGRHIDIGYVQSVDAAVYVSGDYCQTCLNDGLEWQVDAFDSIQDGVDHVPDAAGLWTVGVAMGQYFENVRLKSGVRLVGSGADLTVIDGNAAGSVITIDGATHVEVRGFTLQDGGFDTLDSGIRVAGASNNITLTHNVLFSNGSNGVTFDGGSTGVAAFNTVVDNFGTGLLLSDLGTWVHARFNILAGNTVGLDDSSQSQVFNSYNLFWQNASDAEGNVELDATSVQGDPNFVDPSGVFSLMLPSAAADVVPLTVFKPVPVGGGDMTDLGYQELLAVPLSLMMGKEGATNCGMGASGVATLLAALVKVDDASKSVEETAPPSPDTDPGSWTTVTISDTSKVPGTNKNAPASYWALQTTLGDGDGLYRLYTVPSDVSGNVSSRPGDWYRSRFVADSASPSVTLAEPSGSTTTAPAIQFAAYVTDTVETGAGTRDNVARVYFDVDGAVVTATKKAGSSGRYESHTALADGTHAVKAVALDRAGNIGESSAQSLTVSTPNNEAALVSPAPGSAVTLTRLNLVGYAHYTSTDGDGQVAVSVDGGPVVNATVEEPNSAASRWTAQVTLTGEGAHTLKMTARRSTDPAGAHDTTAQLTLDSVAPTVTVQPQPGAVKFDVKFEGTATDATSDVATVEVSTDGGNSWSAAPLDSGTWALSWTVPLETDYAQFPLRVRATDAAGNMAVKADTFVADNLGPTPFRMTTLEPAEGSHVSAPTQVQLAWTPPEDGSGTVKMIATADQLTNTVPSGTPLPRNEYTAHLDDEGSWYVHVLAEDSGGNQTIRHYGPWYAETDGLRPGSVWRSSIRVDGSMHLRGDEWLARTERMDIDPRGSQPQELWAAFDTTGMFIGWRGANWGADGTGYVYLDTGPGGTTAPMADTGGRSLPMAADVALELSSAGGVLHRYETGSWREQAVVAGFRSARGAHGETEVRAPWSAMGRAPVGGALALLAHSTVRGAAASVFPTDNSVKGPWNSSYRWDDITTTTVPNEGQPEGHHARLAIDSRESPAKPLGPGSAVHYVAEFENLDLVELPGASLVLTASEGLTLETLDGGGGPEPGDVWRIDLGDLPAGSADRIEVAARTAHDVAVAAVGVQAQLEAGVPAAEDRLARATVSHEVDTDGPAVRPQLPSEGATLRSGLREIRGTASDGAGIGVALVEVRVGDGEWIAATGTDGWRARVTVPGTGPFELSARAVDGYGNQGEAATIPVAVDNTPPETALDTTLQVATARQLALSGTARDTEPDGGPIARVEVQIDDGAWQDAGGGVTREEDGSVSWRTRIPLATQEGIPHRVRARAVDQAGNVGAPTEPHRFTVDNRGPASTIEEPRPGSTVSGDGRLLIWGHAHDGWGIEEVEVSADGGRTWHEAKLGAEAGRLLGSEWPEGSPADAAGPNAIYLPSLSKGAGINPGTLWAIEVVVPADGIAIRSRAVDRAGNTEPLRPPVRARLPETGA